jgi:hypothetical protein
MKKAVFEDDKTIPAYFTFPYGTIDEIDIGDFVLACHMSGVVYDCFATNDLEGILTLRKHKVNEYFYNEVQKAFSKFNMGKKDSN